MLKTGGLSGQDGCENCIVVSRHTAVNSNPPRFPKWMMNFFETLVEWPRHQNLDTRQWPQLIKFIVLNTFGHGPLRMFTRGPHDPRILNMKLMNVIVMIAGVLGGGTHTMKLFLFWGEPSSMPTFWNRCDHGGFPKLKWRKNLEQYEWQKNWVCTIEAWPPP